MEKIVCGGFELGEGLQMDGNVLNVTEGLPEVTESGKALISVNGEWVEQDGYGYTDGDNTVHKIDSKYLPEVGGNDIFKVTFSDTPVPGTMPPEFTSDKSAAEMMAAAGSGKLLLAITGAGTMPIYFDPTRGLQCVSTTYRLDGDGYGEIHIFGYTFDMSSETWKYFTDVFSQPD